MIILLFYPQINNFYTYFVPIKHAIDPTPDFLGDIHYEKFPKGTHSYYASIENISPQSDGSLDIDFGKNDYERSNGYQPIPEFSYSTNIGIDQTFAVICHDFTQPLAREILIKPIDTTNPQLDVLKYLGPIQSENGKTLYKFYHVQRTLQTDMPCHYPEIIEHSIDAIDLVVPEEYGKEYDEKFGN
jgi:hypothetical protein